MLNLHEDLCPACFKGQSQGVWILHSWMHQRSGNMWNFIKDFHVPHPIKLEGPFTVNMLREHLRDFKMRSYGGYLRGVNQSAPAENMWLSATRQRDEMLYPSDPNAPIVISFRAIHRELHYLTLDSTWESNRRSREPPRVHPCAIAHDREVQGQVVEAV